MARPSPYDPTTEFASWSADNPGRPIRGQDLDVEFNDISFSLGATQAWLAGITGDSGGLAVQIVQKYHLAPELVDELAGDIYAIVGPTAQQAVGAAAAAQVHATNAESARLQAVVAANAAAGQSDLAIGARQQAQIILNQTHGVQSDAQNSAVSASNAADHALGYRNQTTIARDLARNWAEFIGGPVLPAENLDPDAFDDGYWSAKWWALQAARWVQTGVLPGGGGGEGVPGMAGPEGFGVVVYSIAELEALLGPLADDVALVTDPASIWHFEVGSVLTPNEGVRAPADGTAGRWLKLAFATEASNALTSNEFYEQPTPPIGAGPGAIWIDTSV